MKTLYNVLFLICVFCNAYPISQKTVSRTDSIKIMSFNVLYTTSFESSIKTIKKSDADIIGLQESGEKRMKAIADTLGYSYHSFGKNSANLSDNDTGILTKLPIIETFDNGVLVQLNKNKSIAIFSVHLIPYPYEPYDLRDSKVGSVKEVIQSSNKNRLPQIEILLSKINNFISRDTPIFLMGDFNEPSHLDWTQRAANHNMHFSREIEWPVSKALENIGLKDAYRVFYPDEVKNNGITWSNNITENEVYDRIDFIYHNIPVNWSLKSVNRIGGSDDKYSKIEVNDYQSDHYAIIAKYYLN